MPLDINLFRANAGGNPELIRESQRRRFASVEIVDEIIAKDEKGRHLTGTIDDLHKKRNAVQKEVAVKTKAKEATDKQVAEIKAIDEEIVAAEAEQKALKIEVDRLVGTIGNLVEGSVPVSQDEDKDNLVVRKWGVPRDSTGMLNHHDLLWRIGGNEPERGSQVAGHIDYLLKDAGMLLNQAFINYGIAFLRKRNYNVLQPPYMIKKDMMTGVAQMKQVDEEMYNMSGGPDGEDKYLIATSEQPICGYHANKWLEKSLPIRYSGIFCKEAWSHGKDTWGVFRGLQFEKVEQFAIVEGDLETSNRMQEEMIATAEEFYQSLGFPYHVINIVSGALNNAAIRKYDLECWFPGYNAYRELASCRNCTDYQSRAMEIRCGTKTLGNREKKYVHMLNATLCATGRAIYCLLETYQESDGVRIPEVLMPFMGGITFLPFVRDARPTEKSAAAGDKKKETTGASIKMEDKASAEKPAAVATAATAPVVTPVAAASVVEVTSALADASIAPRPPAPVKEEKLNADKFPKIDLFRPPAVPILAPEYTPLLPPSSLLRVRVLPSSAEEVQAGADVNNAAWLSTLDARLALLNNLQAIAIPPGNSSSLVDAVSRLLLEFRSDKRKRDMLSGIDERLLCHLLYPFPKEDITVVGKPAEPGGCGIVSFGRFKNLTPVVLKTAYEHNATEMAREILKQFILSQKLINVGVFVPKLMGITEDAIVMERVLGGFDFTDNRPMSLLQFTSLVQFCIYLTILGFEHGDLHAGNIMESKTGQLYVIDYGMPSVANCIVDDITSLKILFKYNLKIANDKNDVMSKEISARIKTASERYKAETDKDERINIKKTFYESLVKYLLLSDGDKSVKSDEVLIQHHTGNICSVTKVTKDDKELYAIANMMGPGAQINAYRDPSDLSQIAAWTLFGNQYRDPNQFSLLSEVQLIAAISNTITLHLDHVAYDSHHKLVFFSHDSRSNVVHMALPLNMQDVVDSDRIDFEFVLPSSGVPWARLKIIAVQNNNLPEIAVYEEQLSFITNSEVGDIITGTHHTESGDLTNLIVSIPLNRHLEGERLPSPLLRTFFDTEEEAFALYSSLMRERELSEKLDAGESSKKKKKAQGTVKGGKGK